MQSPVAFFLICAVWGAGSFIALALQDNWRAGIFPFLTCVLLGLVIAGVRMVGTRRKEERLFSDDDDNGGVEQTDLNTP